jgi:YD repeat-containing protein
MRQGGVFRPAALRLFAAMLTVSMIASCTSDSAASDEPRLDLVAELIPGVPGPLSAACAVGICVSEQVLLPQGQFIESAADLDQPEPLQLLAIERVFLGSDHAGLFGPGWLSMLDTKILDGVLSGPLPAIPVTPVAVDADVMLADGTRLRFDSDGRLVEMCPVQGLCAEVEWSDDAVMLTAPDGQRWVEIELVDGTAQRAMTSDGREVTYEMSEGVLASVATEAGTTAYSYDNGRLTSVVEPVGTRLIGYANGRVSEVTDRDGDVWSFAWPSTSSEQVLMSRASGTVRDFTFADGQLQRVVDGDGEILLERDFDDTGQLLEEALPLEGIRTIRRADGSVEVRDSPADGRPARVVVYRYDNAGRVTSADGPDGNFTYLYDGATARLSELRTESGAATRYDYDAHGLLSTVTDPDGYTMAVTRDEDGLPATVSDGVVEQTFTYDARGRTIEQRTGDLVTTYSYDLLGRPLGERTGSQRRGFRYDSAGRLTSVVDNDLRQVYTYDEFGRLIESDSSTGDRLSMSWDGSRTVGSTLNGIAGDEDLAPAVALITSGANEGDYADEAGNVYSFDSAGRPVTVTTSMGTTQRSFDEMGRLASITFPDSRSYTITRSPGGRPTRVTDWAGRELDLAWDGARLTSVTTPAGTTIDYSWNTTGLLGAIQAGPLRWEYAYDQHGYLSEVTTPNGVARHDWDVVGRPTRTIGPDGSETTYDWDGDALARVVADGTALLEIEWDELDRIVAVTTPNGTDSYSYDDTTDDLVAYELGGSDRVDIGYVDGQIATLSSGSRTEEWTWDEGQVTEVRTGDDPDDLYELTWDSPGQLAQIEREQSVIVTVNRDTAHQVTSISAGDDEVARYRWDMNRHLTDAVIDDVALSLSVDADGQITEFAGDDSTYTADYTDGAPTRIDDGDTTLRFQYRDGSLSRSTFIRSDESVTLGWEQGQRVTTMSSDEGSGGFFYADDGRVTSIRYDDRVRDVTYDGDGSPSAEGTGGELLGDLFTDQGLPATLPAAPMESPSIPVLAGLPAELGIAMPDVFSPFDAVDATLAANLPTVPRPLIPSDDPTVLARGLADVTLAGAATQSLPTGPVTGVRVTLTPTTDAIDGLIDATPTSVVAQVTLARLAPDPCLLCRVVDAGTATIAGIANGFTSLWRFVADNAIAQAVMGVAFFAAQTYLCQGSGLCQESSSAAKNAALFLFTDAEFDSITALLESAALAVVQPFINLIRDPSLSTLTAAAVNVAALLPAVGAVMPDRAVAQATSRVSLNSRAVAQRAARSVDDFSCALQRVVCISRSRFGELADHYDDAITSGQPRLLTTGYPGAALRRQDSLRGFPTRIGFDRDEYPFAMTRQGGSGASVRYLDPSLNRAVGSYVRNQLPDRDGYRFVVRIVD